MKWDLIVAKDEGVEVLEFAKRRREGVEEELVVGEVELLEEGAVTDLEGKTVQTVVVHDELRGRG